MAINDKRLIEVAFPLKQASLDSVHEKNVRHGHISTLHIWPARRPLAASRAALIATLLPDPGNKEERDQLLEKLGGKVVQVVKKKKLPSGNTEEKLISETVGGVLHWGQETSPDLEWFRKKILEANGGQAPVVLDPFAGGGAIPLEAMRLGCEVKAVDINPVAWFILNCTLVYPQRLAGQHRALPQFALTSTEFMEQFFKGTSKLTKKQLERNLKAVQDRLFPPPEVDLAWHVRAWGWWVLQKAKEALKEIYPVIGEKKTVAYLWTRTVRCKNCRATIPLLKTRWLCKKDNKRVILTMEPNGDTSGVVFGVQTDVPQIGGNAAQRRENDKRLASGTMSRSGVTCPCCSGAIMTMEELRAEGLSGRIGAVMTSVVVDGDQGKEYRLPTSGEVAAADSAKHLLEDVYSDVPFGIPDEAMPDGRTQGNSGFRVLLYGFRRWRDLFGDRQLLGLGTLIRATRQVAPELLKMGYTVDWAEAIQGYLSLALSRLADSGSTLAHWQFGNEFSVNTFQRFALPMSWDFSEVNFVSGSTGSYQNALNWVSLVIDHVLAAGLRAPLPSVTSESAIQSKLNNEVDVILTDPPYYDAIAYSDVMDFFYIWLRRCLFGASDEIDRVFSKPQSPKWDSDAQDGELIDDSSRFAGDRAASKDVYEGGMARAFQACHRALKPEGRLVVVFANKQPDAWETLATAMIRAGFVVDGSWPIQTERAARTNAIATASLASSVWLVCKKRPDIARPGWDNTVLSEMLERIQIRLREFWDAGITGPDFVWAATGPALEVFSKHPVVRKANVSGGTMSVSEFLGHVRRITVDFIVGQVLSHKEGTGTVSGLDDLTTYYILHRHDFGFGEAPIGACILYAVSCGLTDRELTDRHELLVRTGSGDVEEDAAASEDEATDEDDEANETSGGKVKLKAWNQRHRKNLGIEVDGKPAPLIDRVHRLMGLWKSGDVIKVDEYLDTRALRRNSIFGQLIQALIELAAPGSEERAILESLSNHVAARGVAYEDKQLPLSS